MFGHMKTNKSCPVYVPDDEEEEEDKGKDKDGGSDRGAGRGEGEGRAGTKKEEAQEQKGVILKGSSIRISYKVYPINI